jgi:hypothetical protein
MNLQPSLSVALSERRQLFSHELMHGGHGQVFLSGGGTFMPTTSAFSFYKIDFLTNAVVGNVGFRTVIDGTNFIVYTANSNQFSGASMPAGATWSAPITSITLNSGTGIAYQYAFNSTDDNRYSINL